MEVSYRSLLGNRSFTDEEIGVVVKSTMTLLRRHCSDGTLCPRCGNDDPKAFAVTQIDRLGFITEVECAVCVRPPGRLSAVCHRAHCHYEPIDDPSTLKPGDHVTWHRPYLIWHHALVTKQDLEGREITINEYAVSPAGPYAAIIETKLSYAKCTSCRSGAFYRMVYDDCYPAEYSVLRATKSFGEKKYDVFEQNCEHSTTWCKTGIRDSVQMEVCFTTVAKAALVAFLRLISLIVLWLLQLSRESQPPDERSIRQERYLNAVYMAFVGCLFFAFSLYHSVSRIQPTVSEKRHDTDICGIETGRRWCADVTYKCCCCCGVPHCNRAVLGLCCVSCFFCSLFDACCSVCRKHVQCGSGTICRRPPSVVFGLFIRIFVRETIAAAGPLLVLYFEKEIASHFGAPLEKAVVIMLAIVVASVVAYVVGALIGVWIEALFLCCTDCCCSRSAGRQERENVHPLREEVRLVNSN